MNARGGHVGFAKKRGELMEILLQPIVAKIIVMTLHAVDAYTEKGAGDAGGQLGFVGALVFVLIDGDRHKVHLGIVRPQSFSGDE